MTSLHRRRVHVDLPVERAAQVAVGEDADARAVVSSTTAVMPSPLRLISSKPALRACPGSDRGSLVARAHDVLDVQQQAPSERAARVRAREILLGEAAASSIATASASPIASVAVVLAVGARLSEQASCGHADVEHHGRRSAPSVELRLPGHRDQRHVEPLDHGQDGDELVGLAGVRQREHDVASP